MMNCPICQVAMVLRTNPRGGGRFLGCSTFTDSGCAVSYSLTTKEWFGLPEVISRKAKTRSRCTSLRARTVAMLTARIGFTADEAEQHIDTVGLADAVKDVA